MQYAAKISHEGKHVLAEFPDCPGCQTFVERGADIAAAAHEALEGWLESMLANGEVPPRPRARPKQPGKIILVSVPQRIGVKLALRWARQDAGLSQAQLAKLAGVTRPAIAQLEDPDSNATVVTLEKVAAALGYDLDIAFRRGGSTLRA